MEISNIESMLKQAIPFRRLIMEYECALLEIQTKLDILDKEMSITTKSNPIETVTHRIKSMKSITRKLQSKSLDLTTQNIEQNLNDVAGIRVICSFINDIYTLCDLLLQQDDVVLIEKKDYIEKPKENGYRSLHLIIEIPIFLTNQKKFMRVEVQFRTIAMDFWASLEHKLKYKQSLLDEKAIGDELLECADIIHSLDKRMETIKDQLEFGNV